MPDTAKWGFDLGGTKIEGIILDHSNNPILRKRIPTEADQGYTHVIDQFQRLLDSMVAESGIQPSRIGVGTPGSTDPDTGLLKNCNAQSINKQPFERDLQAKLGLPLTMVNDANCFALAETIMGAVPEVHPEASVVFGIIMGSGVGGGIVVNGKALTGAHGIAGEWGHITLEPEGPVCYCGDKGCAELYLSGIHLEKYYANQSGQHLKLKEIYQRYEQGSDANAIQAMDRLLHYFGIGVANVINILDPDVVVIGGGVSNLPLLYTRGVEAIKRHVFNPSFKTPVIPPKLGDSAGVFGAALL